MKQLKQQHTIESNVDARTALQAIDELPSHSIRTLFLVDKHEKLIGTLTDGDIRRGLLSGLEISDPAINYVNKNFKHITKGNSRQEAIKEFKAKDIFLLPVIDEQGKLADVVDLRTKKAFLPLSAVIMAGGRGERLKPLTDSTPKPMLKVGDKPIIEHNIDRLIAYGVKQIYISVNYLKEHIMEYFGDGSSKGVNIQYLHEEQPLGTLGAVGYINDLAEDNVLVMNSDLLTNMDFEAFFNFYQKKGQHMVVASVPYKVNIPYAVLETKEEQVSSFAEKPTYTYYSNGGIYLFNAKLKDKVKPGVRFDAIDLMDEVVASSKEELAHFPILGYWLDIGKHEDFLKAQQDINRISL